VGSKSLPNPAVVGSMTTPSCLEYVTMRRGELRRKHMESTTKLKERGTVGCASASAGNATLEDLRMHSTAIKDRIAYYDKVLHTFEYVLSVMKDIALSFDTRPAVLK
jgi:hypothetical protein